MGKLSFAAQNLSEGGIIEGDVTLASLKFEEKTSTYNGKQQVTCIVGWQAEEGGEPTPRFYNVGQPKHIQVVDDGEGIDVIDDDSKYQISKQSGFGKLLTALENSGFPTARLDKDGIQSVVGERFHVEQVATGTKNAAGEEKTQLLPTKYLGGDAKSAKKGSAAKSTASKGNGKAKKSDDEDLDATVADFLTELIGAADDNLLNLKGIQQAAFRHKAIKTHDSRKAIMDRIVDPEFLALELGWTFDADAGEVTA